MAKGSETEVKAQDELVKEPDSKGEEKETVLDAHGQKVVNDTSNEAAEVLEPNNGQDEISKYEETETPTSEEGAPKQRKKRRKTEVLDAHGHQVVNETSDEAAEVLVANDGQYEVAVGMCINGTN